MSSQPIEIRIPGSDEPRGGLLCTTTDTLFGELFDSLEDAEDFCEWVRDEWGEDPRSFRYDLLVQLRAEWETKRSKTTQTEGKEKP